MGSEQISPSDYEAFRVFLKDACGIVLGENKHYLVSSRLKKLLKEHNFESIGKLVDQLKRETGFGLKARVIDAMTTNETYWFRDNYPYTSLKENIFPQLSESGVRKPRIWSAACSTGQEPYTISMVSQDYIGARHRGLTDIEIVATDISPTVLQAAKAGVYDELTLSRGLPNEYKARFFHPNGELWQINDQLRRRVRFIELNLMKPFTSLGKFDVIFCRNVLIYFSVDLKKDILNRLADALQPSGHLFLGGSESMANYCDRFETIRYRSGLAYKVKSTTGGITT